MAVRYGIIYDEPKMRIIEAESGEWVRFRQARAAAILYESGRVVPCQRTLEVLRRSASFAEYCWLLTEIAPVIHDAGVDCHPIAERICLLCPWGDIGDFPARPVDDTKCWLVSTRTKEPDI